LSLLDHGNGVILLFGSDEMGQWKLLV
jgi:hypothetical protein